MVYAFEPLQLMAGGLITLVESSSSAYNVLHALVVTLLWPTIATLRQLIMVVCTHSNIQARQRSMRARTFD